MIPGNKIFPSPEYQIFPLLDEEAIPSRLICPWCKLVMRDPVQTVVSAVILCGGCLGESLKYV